MKQPLDLPFFRWVFFQQGPRLGAVAVAIGLLFLGYTAIKDSILLSQRVRAGEFQASSPTRPDVRYYPVEVQNIVEDLRSRNISSYSLEFPRENTESGHQEQLDLQIVDALLPIRLDPGSPSALIPSQIPACVSPPSVPVQHVWGHFAWVLVRLFALFFATLGFGFGVEWGLKKVAGLQGDPRDNLPAIYADLCLYWGILVIILSQLLSLVLPAGLIYGAAALALLGLARRWIELPTRQSPQVNGGLVFMQMVLLLQIVAIPLLAVVDWDARIIWFHSGKVMYYFPSPDRWAILRGQDAFHPDYPKALGALSATVAQYFGYWQDGLAKGAIFILLTPIFLTQRRMPAAMVAATILFSLIHWRMLTNGYMDAILAVYAATLVGCLAELLFPDKMGEIRRPFMPDLVLSFLLMAVLLQLKNEGMVFCLLLAIGVGGRCLLDSSRSLRSALSLRAFMVSFLAVAPFVVWILIKKKYGIHNDLTEGGFHGLLERGWGRLTDGKSLWIILDWFFIKETGAWYFLVYFFFAFGTPFSPAKKKSLFCFTLGAAYLAILLGIFLTTPHDLLWHLTTSIGRVNYIPHILFISAIFYLIFDGAEARSPASPAPEPIRLQS